MLVVNVNILRTVDVLNLGNQIPLKCLFALDAQNIVRHQRPVRQRVASFGYISGMNIQMPVPRDMVFFFHSTFTANNNRHLTLAFIASQLNTAANFRHSSRVFGLAGLKNLRNPGQASGNVLRSAGRPRLVGKQLASLNLLAFVHFYSRPCRQIVIKLGVGTC